MMALKLVCKAHKICDGRDITDIRYCCHNSLALDSRTTLTKHQSSITEWDLISSIKKTHLLSIATLII